MRTATFHWENIQPLREERGLTQKDLALAAGIDHSYICHLEAGRRRSPSGRVVNALVDALGVDRDRLVTPKVVAA